MRLIAVLDSVINELINEELDKTKKVNICTLYADKPPEI